MTEESKSNDGNAAGSPRKETGNAANKKPQGKTPFTPRAPKF